MEHFGNCVVLAIIIGIVNYAIIATEIDKGESGKRLAIYPMIATFIILFFCMSGGIAFITSEDNIVTDSQIEDIEMYIDDINYHANEIRYGIEDNTLVLPFDEELSGELIYFFDGAEYELSPEEIKEEFDYIASWIYDYVGYDSTDAMPVDFKRICESERKIHESCDSISSLLKDQPK